MEGWKAYYADGRVISSADASWSDIPDRGLVGVIVYYDPPYRKIIAGGDWVWKEDGKIKESDTTWDGWVEQPNLDCSSCLKQGEGLPDEEWENIYRKMVQDRQWP